MDETIVTTPGAVVVTNDAEPMDAAQTEPDAGGEATSEADAEAQAADTFRQQICEMFPGVWIGDLPGETFDEVFAALPEALEKSRRTRSTWQPDAIPAGPASRSAVIDLANLSPESKIRAGLRR